MTSTIPTVPYVSVDPATHLGTVSISVADLNRSVSYYTNDIGLEVQERSHAGATLGSGTAPLLSLTEQAGATPWPRGGRSYTGLYHFALLLPSRGELGRWLRHWLDLGHSLPGQADHLVSEAFYLEDPDGHGIEIYRDRPRDEWNWDGGGVVMAADPLDISGILGSDEAGSGPWNGMHAGITMGHIHLQVGDLASAQAFYHGVLGFDVVRELPTAAFVSAGGYHHHIGMNVWHSLRSGAPPETSVRLRSFEITLPTVEALDSIAGRIESAGVWAERRDDRVWTRDPWGTSIVLRSDE